MPHADVRTVDGRDVIGVTTLWNEKELVKRIPGKKWNGEIGQWTLPLTWASCVTLRGIFQRDLSIGDGLRKWAWEERRDRIEPALNLRMQTEPADPDLDLGGLYPFQFIGREFLDIAGSALLGDEMGTGKTIQALAAGRLRGEDVLPALVICPNGVKRKWEKQARKWFPEAKPIVISGSAAEKRKLFAGPVALNPNALVIMNIEAVRLHSRLASYGSFRLARCRECDKKTGDPQLPASRCEVHHKELNDIPFKTVILDEAHRIVNPASKQTRACWAVGHQSTVKRRWALTGTPIANAPDDLWSVMHFVEPSEYPSRTAFVDRYCLLSWNDQGGTDVVGVAPEHRDEFYAILDPRFRRMPKALVLPQLPPKVYETRYVQMSPKQAKAYKELERGLLTVLDDGNLLTAANNLVMRTRLMQFAATYCNVEYTGEYDEHGNEKFIVHMVDNPASPKLDEMMEVLDELGNKQVLISAESRQLIMLAAARLQKAKISHTVIVGGQSELDREHNRMQFMDGKVRVCLFNFKAGGTGLDLQASDVQIRLQRSWSMIDYLQSEDRNHRPGSERFDSVTYIDIVTEGTVEDEVQLPRLETKRHRLEEITRDKATLLRAGQSIAELEAEESRILASDVGSE